MIVKSSWRYFIHFVHELVVTVAGGAVLLQLLERWRPETWIYVVPALLTAAVVMSGVSILLPLSIQERSMYHRWGYLKLPVLAGLGLLCSGSNEPYTLMFNGALVIQSLLVVRDIVTGKVFS